MPVEVFPQLISLRLDEAGELFRGADGAPSPYAPGHGDLTFALRLHGVLERFRRGGGKLLYMSNVDNLAATLEPAVIGAHLEAGAAVTAEVVAKDPGDKGGAPARVDGVPQIVEDFRFPEGFDQDRIPVFNVNSFCLDAAAIDSDFSLSWFVVKKSVDGRPAIQFEHLVGELTAFLPSRFLHVERRGPDGRFQPVKDPDELQRRRPDIEAIMRARGVP
jgi:UTP--glucose-1-phosphate uridylyltransferase